jgi:uncharacterized protein
MYYLDTSFLIASLTEEANTKIVRRWLAEQDATSLAISHWVAAEVPSALSIKVRTGALPIDEQREVMTAWTALAADHFVILDVRTEDFRAAAVMSARHQLTLRAGDALHLAIARRAGCTLVTLDKRLAEAAPHVGVLVANLLPD